MAIQAVNSGSIHGNVEQVAPTAQASTGAYVVLAGSEIDARLWRTLAYTIAIITQSVYWKVFGANASDYSDEQEVLGETSVAAAASGAYTVVNPPYAFYRVKIKSNSGVGTATLRGIAKP